PVDRGLSVHCIMYATTINRRHRQPTRHLLARLPEGVIAKGETLRTPHRLLGALVAASLVLAACGGDDDDDAGDSNDAPAGSDAGPAPTQPSGSGSDDTAAPGTDAPPVDGAEITIALGSEPTSLDPHLVDDGGERAINDNIYETLLARTPDGELIPSLATDLPTMVDDTTWEFTLRDDVTFHDGTPFNA